MSPAPTLPAWVDQYADRRVWCCWGWRRTKANKITKPPLLPSGALASSTDPETWVTLPDALLGLERGTMDGRPLQGIGLVLTSIEDLLAVDLDHCFDPKAQRSTPWAHDIVAQLQSYTEITPSATGLRVIGTVPSGWRDKIHVDIPMDQNGGHCELFYRAERYVTISGELLPGAPEELADVAQAGADIIARLLPQGRTARADIINPAPAPDLAPPTPGDLQETLWKISPEIERGEWVRVAAVLKYEGGDAARQMFLDWSATSETWGEENRTGNAEELWDGLAPNGGVGYGTLIHLARTRPRAPARPAKTARGSGALPPPELWYELVMSVSKGAAVLFIEVFRRRTSTNNGKIRLSHDEVVQRFGWSHTMVKQYFGELQRTGFLKTTYRGRATKGTCNLYWIREK